MEYKQNNVNLGWQHFYKRGGMPLFKVEGMEIGGLSQGNEGIIGEV